jgi:hypothetical protein
MLDDPIRRNWLIGLTAAVATLYAWTGLAAGGLDRALPLAGATWWSIVTPLLAALALVLGELATRRTDPTVRRRPKDIDRPAIP